MSKVIMKIQINFNNGDHMVADLIERNGAELKAYCKYMSDAVATDYLLSGDVECWESAVDDCGVNVVISLENVSGMSKL